MYFHDQASVVREREIDLDTDDITQLQCQIFENASHASLTNCKLIHARAYSYLSVFKVP